MYLCVLNQRYVNMSLELYKEVLRMVLPDALLDYFDLVDVQFRAIPANLSLASLFFRSYFVLHI